MKKLLGLVAFVTLGLAACTHDAPARAPAAEPAAVSVAASTTEAAAAASCPIYAPRCCVQIGDRCLECVGWNQQCR